MGGRCLWRMARPESGSRSCDGRPARRAPSGRSGPRGTRPGGCVLARDSQGPRRARSADRLGPHARSGLPARRADPQRCRGHPTPPVGAPRRPDVGAAPRPGSRATRHADAAQLEREEPDRRRAIARCQAGRARARPPRCVHEAVVASERLVLGADGRCRSSRPPSPRPGTAAKDRGDRAGSRRERVREPHRSGRSRSGARC